MDARPTLQTLRARMVAADLRSRSIRLVRCTKAGAFDLATLAATQPDACAQLLEAFGAPKEAPVALVNPKSPRAEEREAAHRLLTLSRSARATWLETGADELALGWPLCEARSVEGTWMRAPLLLAPLTLERHRTNASLLATVAGPVELNTPFARVLAREFGTKVSLDGLLDGDEDGRFRADASTFADLIRSLQALGLHIPAPDLHPPHDDARWRLLPIETRLKADRERLSKGSAQLVHAAVVGRFPRGGSQLVADYDAMLEGLEDGAPSLGACAPLLRTLTSEGQTPSGPASKPKAKDPLGARQWQVLPSDASQDTVFREVFDVDSEHERGVVVQGPPGTGKSQMLANVLAAAAATGKKTLVVCQKRAALDVVAQRLDAVGLGDACLVVHDTARDRSEVAAQIAARLSPLLADAPEHAAADAQAIAAHARAAARYRSHLDASQAAFDKLTQAPPGRPPLLALLEDAIEDAPATGDDARSNATVSLRPVIAGVTEAEVDVATLRATLLAPRAKALAAPHPLHVRNSFAGLDDAQLDAAFAQIEQALGTLRRFVDGEVAAMETAEVAVPFSTLRAEQRAFEAAKDALDCLRPARNERSISRGEKAKESHAFRLFWAWTGGDDATGEWHRVQSRLQDALDRFVDAPRALVAAPQHALDAWAQALEAGEAAENKWYRFTLPTHWASRKAIREVAERTHGDEGTRGETLAKIRAAEQWRDLIAELPDDNAFLEVGVSGARADLEAAFDHFATDHARLTAIHTLAESLRTTLAQDKACGAESPLKIGRPKCDATKDPWTCAALAAADRLARHREACEAAKSISRYFAPVDFAPWQAALEHGDGTAALAALDAFVSARTDAKAARVHDEEMREDATFLVYFLRRYRGDAPAADLVQASRVAFREEALDGRDPGLLQAPVVDKAALEATADAATACRTLAAAAAAATRRQRVRERAKRDGASLRALLAQCEKKRRRPTLRALTLDGEHSGLMTLVPVWLCSPDSVANLFAAHAGVFDLVIFDEASQCPVEAGLPALWRGRTIVIAGDDQQMPPSHFFSSRDDEEEEEDHEDVDADVIESPSLLALSRRAFPARALRYHYRSEDDALIAFSNAAFYRGQLTIAPRAMDFDPRESDVGTSATKRALGFRYLPVGGFWRKQTNATEADAIVSEVERTLTFAPHLSVGVVCMNRPQADLVAERLDARALESDRFAALLANDRKKPPMDQLFVRNLENVQGDERDVILFSIGYGREEAGGPVRARLGPLAQAGGEKRLNVAITRAKRQVVVVLSFAPEEMDTSRAKHVGPKLFQLWLQYARACARNENAAGILSTAGGLLSGTHAGDDGDRPPLALGQRLRAHLRPRLEAEGWSADVGLGRETIDFVRGNDALDVTSFWTKPDAISRDVTSLAFWRRAGFDVERVTPVTWPASS